jgi:phosphoribosylformylglycinamidine synthase
VLYRVEPAGQGLEDLAAAHRQVAAAIRTGRIVSCHDVSEGGWLVAAAEMCIGSGLGLLLEPDDRGFFDEPVGQYLLEFEGDDAQFEAMVKGSPALRFHRLGAVQHSPEIVLHLDEEGVHVTVDELTKAWRGTLDW